MHHDWSFAGRLCHPGIRSQPFQPIVWIWIISFFLNAGFRRKKTCPFSGPDAIPIDYKDVKTLQKFISERGKIIPARISAVSSPKQRKLAQAIKRARALALLPFVGSLGR